VLLEVIQNHHQGRFVFAGETKEENVSHELAEHELCPP
jgi:hypothetical protein